MRSITHAAAVAALLCTLLMAGCATKAPVPTPTTPSPAPATAAQNPADQEKAEPLTATPSKPATLQWPTAPTVSDTDVNNAIVKAQQLINSQKAADAVNLLQPLAGVKNRDLQIALAQALYGTKNMEAAAEAYLRAIDVDPKVAVAHNNLGNIYRDQLKYDLAVAEYQKAISLDPHNQFSITNLQSLLHALHRSNWAKQVLLQGIGANPNYADLRAQLGDLMASQKNYQEARDAYQAALKIDPSNAQAKRGLDSLPK